MSCQFYNKNGNFLIKITVLYRNWTFLKFQIQKKFSRKRLFRSKIELVSQLDFVTFLNRKKYGYVFWDFYEKISAFIWSQILYNAYSFDYFLCKHSKTHFRFAKGENDESQFRILRHIPKFQISTTTVIVQFYYRLAV